MWKEGLCTQRRWLLRTKNNCKTESFSLQLTSQSKTWALGPVATRAGTVKDQTSSTVLKVGLAVVAVVKLVLVCWVGVHATGLSSTETAVHAAGARVPTWGAASTGAASRAASSSRTHSCDWRKWSGRRGTGWKTSENYLITYFFWEHCGFHIDHQ